MARQPDSFTTLIRRGANPAWVAEVCALSLSLTPDRDVALQAAASVLEKVPRPPEQGPAELSLEQRRGAGLDLLDDALARQRRRIIAEAPPGVRDRLEEWLA